MQVSFPCSPSDESSRFWVERARLRHNQNHVGSFLYRLTPRHGLVNQRMSTRVFLLCTVSLFALLGSFLFLHYADARIQFSIKEEDHLLPQLPPSLLINNTTTHALDYYHDSNSNSTSTSTSTCTCLPLKVYMYDLPPEFHFGMINPNITSTNGRLWPHVNQSEIPRYPGGLNQQHSPEYWLALDLLLRDSGGNNNNNSSSNSDNSKDCTEVVTRVRSPEHADLFFVPFFSSLSFNRLSQFEGTKRRKNRNVELQEGLVRFLQRQKPWRTSGGRDHIIMMHHPNSLHVARDHLCNSLFVVADFGRYPARVANVYKDVVTPYKHVLPTFTPDTSSYHTRPMLLFFQGAIVRKEGGIIRQQLYEILKSEAGVHFTTGNTQRGGFHEATRGMRESKYCLHLAGDTPSSNRLFDAIASHCVPVIVSDAIELPFEDALDYSGFCIFVRTSDALRKDFLIKLLQGISEAHWTRMWMRLKEIDGIFEYQYPSKLGDAVYHTWAAIARRLPSIRQSLHKASRYYSTTLLE